MRWRFPSDLLRLPQGSLRFLSRFALHFSDSLRISSGFSEDTLQAPLWFLQNSFRLPSRLPQHCLRVPLGFPQESLEIPFGSFRISSGSHYRISSRFSSDSFRIPISSTLRFPWGSLRIVSRFPQDSLRVRLGLPQDLLMIFLGFRQDLLTFSLGFP